MTITYPLSLPTVTGMKRVRIRPNNTTGLSVSPYTAEQQSYEYQAKWWAADVTLPTLVPAKASVWEAFILSLNGRKGTFLLGDPMRAAPFGAASASPGTPVVNGAHSARVATLNISGAPVSTTAWMKAADQFQLGSGSGARLHSFLQDVDTDGSGEAVAAIWPPLRTDLAGGEALTLTSPQGVFRLAADENPFDRARGPHTMISFSCREVL